MKYILIEDAAKYAVWCFIIGAIFGNTLAWILFRNSTL
jgi:hypothetical protein